MVHLFHLLQIQSLAQWGELKPFHPDMVPSLSFLRENEPSGRLFYPPLSHYIDGLITNAVSEPSSTSCLGERTVGSPVSTVNRCKNASEKPTFGTHRLWQAKLFLASRSLVSIFFGFPFSHVLCQLPACMLHYRAALDAWSPALKMSLGVRTHARGERS